MDAAWRGVTQGSTATDNRGGRDGDGRLIDLGRRMESEAGRAGAKSSTNGSSHRNMVRGRGTNTQLGPKKIGLTRATHGASRGWPNVEVVSHGTSCSGGIETEAGTPLTSLNGSLLLLLNLLSQHLILKLLGLHGLRKI